MAAVVSRKGVDVEVNDGPDGRAPTCLDCDTGFLGPYCHSCGRKNRLPARPLGRFLRDAWTDLGALGRRLARSLRTLMLEPGQLSLEYLQGQHRSNIDPIRLFLDVGVGAFLVTRILPSEVELFGIGPALFGKDPSVTDWLAAVYGVVAAASAHWLILRTRRPLFVESAVFVLHVTAFSFVLAPVGGLLSLVLGSALPALQPLANLVPPLALITYWVLALYRFNGSDRQRNAKDVLLIYLAFVVLSIPLLLLELL